MVTVNLDEIPVPLRREILKKGCVDFDEVRMAIRTRTGRPLNRDTVQRVFLGKGGQNVNPGIRVALEEKLAALLVPGNELGWWPGVPKSVRLRRPRKKVAEIEAELREQFLPGIPKKMRVRAMVEADEDELVGASV